MGAGLPPRLVPLQLKICYDVAVTRFHTRPKTFDIGNDRRLFRPFTIPSTNRKRSEGATISVEVVHGLHDTIWFSSTCTVRYRSKSFTAVSHNTNGGNLVLIWKPRTRDLNSSRNLTRKVFSLFLFGDYK